MRDAAVCVACGVPMGRGNAYCQSCGQRTHPQAQVCTSCGVLLSNAPSGYDVKSKLTAGLLGIFLGHLGIHRFYLGYTGIGLTILLLNLVLAWPTLFVSSAIASVWGIVEGIMILTGGINKDAQGRPLRD